GTVAASGGGDGSVRLWDLPKQRVQSVLKGHQGRVQGLAVSPDGETIATGGDGKSIRFWDAANGPERTVGANLPPRVRGLAFSSDATLLAAAVDRDVYYWKLNNRHEPGILHAHQRPIAGLVFLPGRLELVTFAGDKTVRFWDL